jgi:glycosyltransferase involved in cell wall biosynthesis
VNIITGLLMSFPVKIAQIAPLFESVPPKFYGGTERIVSYLTEELVRQGHEVTLFAAGDSNTSAELVAINETALRLSEEHRNPVLEHVLMMESLRARSGDFDILHFHTDLLQFPFLRTLGRPSLTTLHGRLDEPGVFQFYQEFSEAHLAAISRSQRRSLPKESQVSVVHHGLPAHLLPCTPSPGQYLAFLGRIASEKGVLEAIAIAVAAGLPLKIAAKVDKSDKTYWEEIVRPLIERSPNVEYVGEITEREKIEFLGNAMALLFPIDWPEPFGLVMIEAMACGTPVIAYPMGSVPEVIDEGRSGFIVGTVDAAVKTLDKIEKLDRKIVRQCFDRRFTVEHMTGRYTRLYEKLSDSRPVNGHKYGRPLAPLSPGLQEQAIGHL